MFLLSDSMIIVGLVYFVNCVSENWCQVDILVLLLFCLAGSRLFWQAQPPQELFGLFWGRLLAQVGAPLSSLNPNGTSQG